MKLIYFDHSISEAQQIVLSQARHALYSVIDHIDAVYALADGSMIQNAIVEPNLATLLSDICNQQAVASTILFDNVTRTRENAAARQFRAERVALVAQRTAGFDLAVLTNKKVRNSLTHIDEYLATALRRPNTGWAIDQGFGNREDLYATLENHSGAAVAFCRCYVMDEDVLLHLDNEISLNGLRREAGAVLTAVYGNPPLEEPVRSPKSPKVI